MKYLLLIILSLNVIGLKHVKASNGDSTKVRKNIIRWNPTPMLLVGPKSLVLGYERIIKKGQSISINIGYMEKAPLEDQDGVPLKIFDQSTRGGLDISLDYRFYFSKRNKYPAPDGLYWGPYIAYYGLWQDASLKIIDKGSVKNTVYYKGDFQMYSLGLQLGYQFIIKKRFSIDLILIGPSYSYYDLNLNLRFETDIDINDPFYQNLMDYLKENSPFISEFVKNKSFSANGRLKLNYMGFRYAIQFGYHF